ncbi:MAG: SIMPL domain-containing protein [Ignavibacteria bacterium]|jgi:uncharacterized protein YggE
MKKILILFLLPCFYSLNAQDLSRFIDVNGTAEIVAEADHIFFNVQIRNVAETLEQSKQVNLNASDELVKILNEFNIAKEDWEISPIKFGKEYSYMSEERKLIGYFSQVNVTVKLRNFTDYYEFITKLSKNSLYEVVSSGYGVSDLIKYHKEATIKATKAAKEKAEYIAESMGVKVGKIIQIKEHDLFESYPKPLNSVTMIAESKEDISGKVKISRSINMKLEIMD